jgi:hypothetical protein
MERVGRLISLVCATAQQRGAIPAMVSPMKPGLSPARGARHDPHRHPRCHYSLVRHRRPSRGQRHDAEDERYCHTITGPLEATEGGSARLEVSAQSQRDQIFTE